MAEFAALQIAASIIQVIDIGTRVIKRIEEYRRKGNDLPRSFKHISKRLPIFVDALRQTNEAVEIMTDSTRRAFAPAIKECRIQIQKLDDILLNILPKAHDNDITRSWKAIVSVKYDSEVKEMDRVIKDYMEVIAQHQTSTLVLGIPTSSKRAAAPAFLCPYPRDTNFVNRSVMDEVLVRCQPGSRLALTGIGGVGKSQIAIEYVYRVHNESPQTWVFWVSARDAFSVETDYRRIAKAVGLPGWDEKYTDILSSVRDWLMDDTNGPWVMVIDSADDTDVLTAPVHKSQSSVMDSTSTSALPQLREFMTVSPKGSVLITSTNMHAAQMLTGNCASHVDVEEMNEGEALALLKGKLHSKVLYTEDEAKQLVIAAERMPLAISQTASHISLAYPRLNLTKATEKLLHPDQDTTRLLEASIHESNRDARRTNSIVNSWHMAFQYVRETSPSASRLLSLMCLFDQQGIPEALLTGRYGENKTTVLARPQPHLSWWKRMPNVRKHRHQQVVDSNLVTKAMASSFHDDWCVLHSLMLIKTNLDGHHFSMHRLVQHTTRRWLEISGELGAWTNRYVNLMRDYFPEPQHDNWKVCQYLFPHAQQATNYRPLSRRQLQPWAQLLQVLSEFAYVKGDAGTAERLGRAALSAFEAVANDQQGNMLHMRCLHQLGIALSGLERYEEAEVMFRRAWDDRLRLLGPDHLDTLASVHRLGCVLNAQEKWEEGEIVQMQAVEGYERVFGSSHIETQSLMSRLALSYLNSGRHEQAERLHRRVFSIRKGTTEQQSDDVYNDMRALAVLLNLQNKTSEAESLHRQVVEAKEARYGLQHAETIKSINFLGEVLVKQAKLDEATKMFWRIYKVMDYLDEEAREAALASLDVLAQILLREEHFAEAEGVASRMVNDRERFLGPSHLDTLIGVHTLADILTQQRRYSEAVLLYERAFTGTKDRLGSEHPDTIEFLNDFNSARNRALTWHEEHRQSLAACGALTETMGTSPLWIKSGAVSA